MPVGGLVWSRLKLSLSFPTTQLHYVHSSSSLRILRRVSHLVNTRCAEQTGRCSGWFVSLLFAHGKARLPYDRAYFKPNGYIMQISRSKKLKH